MGKDRGAALLTSLILLLLISMLAVGSVRLSMGGLRGAVNEELRLEAFHRAQSLIDATLSIPGNTVVTGLAGEVDCLPSVSGCTRNSLRLPQADADAYEGMAESGISVSVRRLGPDFAPPPRFAGYSAVKFEAAYMQIESRYDETASGWGRAEVNEGVAVIVPTPGG